MNRRVVKAELAAELAVRSLMYCLPGLFVLPLIQLVFLITRQILVYYVEGLSAVSNQK